MAGSCEYGWLNAQRADGRCARDTMMMMMMSTQRTSSSQSAHHSHSRLNSSRTALILTISLHHFESFVPAQHEFRFSSSSLAARERTLSLFSSSSRVRSDANDVMLDWILYEDLALVSKNFAPYSSASLAPSFGVTCKSGEVNAKNAFASLET